MGRVEDDITTLKSNCCRTDRMGGKALRSLASVGLDG